MKTRLNFRPSPIVLSCLIGMASLSSCPQSGGLGAGLSGTWQGTAQFEAKIIPGRYAIQESNGKLTGNYQNCNENFSQCQAGGTIVGTRDQNSISFLIKVNNQDAAEFIGTTDSTQKIMDGTIRDSDGTGTLRLDKK
jgi:hypothetical protein